MELLSHKKLHHNYEILDNTEAGISLSGQEVKSLKSKAGNLEGNKVIVRGGSAYVVGMYIPSYQENNNFGDYDPYKTRQLLLHRGEILDMVKREETHKVSFAINRVYITRKLIKVNIAICKKKTATGRKDDIKEREKELRAKKSGSTNWKDYE